MLVYQAPNFFNFDYNILFIVANINAQPGGTFVCYVTRQCNKMSRLMTKPTK